MIVTNSTKKLIYDLTVIQVNIKKSYRYIVHKMLDNANDLLTCIYEANGVITLRGRLEKISTGIALVRNIANSIVLLFEVGVITQKQYIKLGSSIEQARRYMLGWQRYWLKILNGQSGNIKFADVLIIPPEEEIPKTHVRKY